MKRWLWLLLVLPIVACSSSGFFDGSWQLQENACVPFIDFPDVIALNKKGSTVIDGEFFDIYRVTATFEEDNFALIGQDSGEFLLCLNPLNLIDPDQCVQLCSGDAITDEIRFSCELGVAGMCGPVRFGRVL